jgi:hypothetical protein
MNTSKMTKKEQEEFMEKAWRETFNPKHKEWMDSHK